MYTLWENHAILNEIDLKRSSSRCSRGHNLHPRGTDFMQALSYILFFPFDDF